MNSDQQQPSASNEVAIVVEAPGIRTRQLWLTAVVIALSIWMALEFLAPLAWAALIAMAEWPLYRRALTDRAKTE